MSGYFKARSILASLIALGLAYGLWTLSEVVEDRLNSGALFPLVRLAMVFLGLSVSERIFVFVQSHWFRRKS